MKRTTDASSDTAFIDGWLTQFRKDKRMLIYACGLAQKAVNYILNIPLTDQEQTNNDTAEN